MLNKCSSDVRGEGSILIDAALRELVALGSDKSTIQAEDSAANGVFTDALTRAEFCASGENCWVRPNIPGHPNI